MPPARVAAPVRDARRLGRHRRHASSLQSRTRSGLSSNHSAVLVGEPVPVLAQIRNELLAVGRPADLVADRVQLQLDARQPQPAEEGVADSDRLGVGARVLGPEHLDPELAVLPVPALLRTQYRYILVELARS